MSFLYPKMLLCFTGVPRILDLVTRVPQIARVRRPLAWKAVFCWLVLLLVAIRLLASVYIPSPGIGGGGMGGAGGCGGLG